jgi:hypothetical protein
MFMFTFYVFGDVFLNSTVYFRISVASVFMKLQTSNHCFDMKFMKLKVWSNSYDFKLI